MAHKNALKAGFNFQKKAKSVLSVKVDDDFLAFTDSTKTTGNFLVAKLPANAVITDAYVVVNKVCDAATSATAQLGTAEGGAQLIAAVDIKTKAVAGSLVGKTATGTGQDIFLKLTLTGAATTIGDVDLVLEYTEYEKVIGEYTAVS